LIIILLEEKSSSGYKLKGIGSLCNFESVIEQDSKVFYCRVAAERYMIP